MNIEMAASPDTGRTRIGLQLRLPMRSAEQIHLPLHPHRFDQRLHRFHGLQQPGLLVHGQIHYRTVVTALAGSGICIGPARR
jgi:hypothetical protein